MAFRKKKASPPLPTGKTFPSSPRKVAPPTQAPPMFQTGKVATRIPPMGGAPSMPMMPGAGAPSMMPGAGAPMRSPKPVPKLPPGFKPKKK